MSLTLNKLQTMFPKRQFDPTKKEDMLAYKKFMVKNSWGANGCPFLVEWPFLSVPDMMRHRISEYAVSKV